MTNNIPTLFDICAAGAQIASMRDPRNAVLNNFADLLTEELIAIHAKEVAPQYADAVKQQRTDRAARVSKANAAAVEQMQKEGPPLWAEWHKRALAWKGGDDTQFIKSIVDRIPCSNCKRHFIQIISNNAPDFTFGNYFDYTVKVHNMVSLNCEPAKPQLSVEQARSIWS